MSSLDQILEAVVFSYNSMTTITWVILVIGVFKTLHSFIKAFKDNETFADMQANEDKSGIVQFYYGVTIAVFCVFVFFLPYLFKA